MEKVAILFIGTTSMMCRVECESRGGLYALTCQVNDIGGYRVIFKSYLRYQICVLRDCTNKKGTIEDLDFEVLDDAITARIKFREMFFSLMRAETNKLLL